MSTRFRLIAYISAKQISHTISAQMHNKDGNGTKNFSTSKNRAFSAYQEEWGHSLLLVVDEEGQILVIP